MTLRQFFDLLTANPQLVLGFFIILPITALITGFMSKGEGHFTPWKQFYATLIYLACVPGIFAITLNLYLFLFEKHSIYDANLYTQVVPILSMILTLYIIKQSIDLDAIPGFDKLSGLLILIFVVLAIMWVVDSTRIFIGVFSFMPFWVVLLIFAGSLFVLRTGLKRLSR